MRRLWSSIAGVIAVAAIMIGINLFAETNLSSQRLDLTEGRLYTLADGTRKVLAGLKEPITLRLFYSRKLGAAVPTYGAYADQVREMLLRYASLSNGKIKLEFYDPEPFSDIEDKAVAYGLQGVPVEAGGSNVWFGLAGSNLEDDERTIAFFQTERQRFLEYDLTKLVYDLSNPTRPVVGIMTSLPMDGDPRASMMVRRQGGNPAGVGEPYAVSILLRQANTIKNVPMDAKLIDPDIQVLLVAEAQELSETALYAIDQFVMRGGRLMAMVDPYSETAATMVNTTGQPPATPQSDLKKLFDAWGIKFDVDQPVGDMSGAWRVRASADDRVQAVSYVAWFSIRDGINQSDPATANLKSVNVATPGFLSKADGANIEFTPLLTTSPRSGLLQKDQLKIPEPAKILATFKPDGQQRVVAARIRGALKSAFAAPPELAKEDKWPDNMPAHKAATDGPANMVVVADSDILGDRYWVRVSDFFGQSTATPIADNGPFVANTIGTLTGSDALFGLRARGETNRPFTLIAAMQSNAEAQYRQTEQALQKHLEEVEKQLRTLRSGSSDGKAPKQDAVVTPEQRDAIEAARKDILDTRQKLRAVQLELNREISRLETQLRVVNIVLIPALLAVLAIVIGIVQRSRRARARA